jgi:hypothetical protein
MENKYYSKFESMIEEVEEIFTLLLVTGTVVGSFLFTFIK